MTFNLSKQLNKQEQKITRALKVTGLNDPHINDAITEKFLVVVGKSNLETTHRLNVDKF